MNPDSAQAGMMNEIRKELGRLQSVPPAHKALPDAPGCAGRRLAESHMVACVGEACPTCEFAIELSARQFCYHPHRLEIAARTAAIRRGTKKKPRA